MGSDATNRVWRLTARPKGNDFKDALTLKEEPAPAPQDGELLVRNHVLSMDSGTRMYMTDREDSYQPGTPLGDPMLGTVIGEVAQSKHPAYREGDLVRCYGNWSDWSIAAPELAYVAKLDGKEQNLADYVGIFGANGWTAFLGVVEYGAARAGDTFLVSAAAGCTGSLAGQIAKIAGCRTIGLAGTDAKCSFLKNDLGFDDAVNYRCDDLAAAIKSVCPNGVNLYFDNVGGDVLDAALVNMADFGRVAVCGLLANYSAEGPVPGPYKFDLVLMKRLTIQGFFSPDFYHREAEINPILRQWRNEGLLKLPIEETLGLENTVEAYSKLFTGANIGKVVVRV